MGRIITNKNIMGAACCKKRPSENELYFEEKELGIEQKEKT